METGVKYTDCLRTLHERDVLRLTEQEKQMMCDKKFFTGMDFEIEFLVNELAKVENPKEEYKRYAFRFHGRRKPERGI